MAQTPLDPPARSARSSPPQACRIGIIGIGAMGKGLLHQSRITPGVECVAVCDRELRKCTSALEAFGIRHAVVEHAGRMQDVIAGGAVAVCEDGDLLATCDALDLVIEASSSIGPAVGYAITAIEHGKHLVLMNAEIDLLYGALLADLAARHGVVSTSCDGDQYGVLKHLLDDLRAWGFELVMAGNIKGYLDRFANPTSIIPEADKRNLDYRMCASYTDGTKLSVEMAIVANAFGMSTVAPGMLGPRAGHVSEVFTCFDLEKLWRQNGPFVDYLLGAEPGGGVFAVGHCEHPYQREMLRYYKMGDGPFYLFHRPYHLCHVEAMPGVLAAAREGRVLLQPERGFRTNVYAYAKKDLAASDELDGMGGHACYGMIENCSPDGPAGIPVCLADKVRLRRSYRREERILLADVEFDPERADFRLFEAATRLAAKRA